MPTRPVLIIGGVASGLIGIIWVLAILFGGADDASGKGSRKKSVICTKDKEILISSKKICIYSCENGEKTQTSGLDKCLAKIEL
jgi:hypothetical protein